MENSITQLIVIAVAILPFCNGLTQATKPLIGLKSQYIPALAILIGMFIGGVFRFLPGVEYNLAQMIIAGSIAGLSSSGFYDFLKK